MEQKEPYSRVEIVLAILEHASAYVMTISFPGLTGTSIWKWDRMLFLASRMLGDANHPLLASIAQPEYDGSNRAYYPDLAEELRVAVSLCCRALGDELTYSGKDDPRAPYNRLNRESPQLAAQLCQVAAQVPGFFAFASELADSM